MEHSMIQCPICGDSYMEAIPHTCRTVRYLTFLVIVTDSVDDIEYTVDKSVDPHKVTIETRSNIVVEATAAVPTDITEDQKNFGLSTEKLLLTYTQAAELSIREFLTKNVGKIISGVK